MVGLGGVTLALIEAPHHGAVVLPAVVGFAALAAFPLRERRAAHPMLPLGIFASRAFTSANLVTFVVYAALGGTFFLLVSFLQVTMGYSPMAAGAASLPVTALMLAFSARAGALAERIGPRVPLTIGPLLIACGMLLMTRIGRGDGYVTSVLPAVAVFGVGLSATVAPVTATVLAAADAEHSGVASGVNNAVARAAQLLAVAVLPAAAGLSGGDYLDPEKLTHGFHTAMTISAAAAAAGGALAWATISSDILGKRDEHIHCAATDRQCPVAGTMLRPAARPAGRT
jgi:Na+/melibiose symporter-like transporter